MLDAPRISSDEAGESPSSSAAARLQLLRREWLQATAKPTAPGPVPAGSRGWVDWNWKVTGHRSQVEVDWKRLGKW